MSSYSLPDLGQLAGVTPRTVRFYVATGLLRSPSGGGAGAHYDDGHLNRIRLIRQLQKEHLPLAEIRNRLAALSDEDVERLAVGPSPATDSAANYIERVLGTRALKPSTAPAAPAASMSTAPGQMLLGQLPQADAARRSRPDRSTWERVALGPDVELHVRRPLSRDANRRVDRLIEVAHQLFEEEPS